MIQMTTKQVEERLYFHFCKKAKLIALNLNYLPKVFSHEMDVLLISKSNYLTEIEIKISKSDLKVDFKKKHNHPIQLGNYRIDQNGEKVLTHPITIKQQYFAIPYYLMDCIELIPQHFGVLIVKENGFIKEVRKPRVNKARTLTDEEVLHLATLQAKKYWYQRVGTHL
ncbi:MAG: hypothetical protein ACRC0V_04465, partial [Fusobacteriaceae bacterium]